MNELFKELARKSYFDPDQIVAEIVCPDYNGPELFKLADAFNALPKEVRNDIITILEKNQQTFVKLIVQECIKACNSRVGNSDYNTGRMHCVSDIREHFGINNE